MSGTDFKRRLHDGSDLTGLFCCSYSVQMVEALAGSGLDFLLFDAEHAPHALPQLHAQLCALSRGATAPIVRLGGVDPAAIKQFLDLGVAGLMVPNVIDADQAAAVVGLCRYPPRGVRGIARTVRATNYGRDRD